jgi:hypothetical protein
VSYLVPKIDVNVSGTFQDLPGTATSNSTGISMSAIAGVPAANTTLGRAYSSGGNRFFNIIEAGDLYVERMRQLDLRLAKIFRLGSTRTSVNFDFFNVLNSNAVINENITYGVIGANTAAWRTPQLILLPRIFKLSAQFDF